MLDWLMARSGYSRIGLRAQGLVEYALILLLVMAVVVGTLTTFGAEVSLALGQGVGLFP